MLYSSANECVLLFEATGRYLFVITNLWHSWGIVTWQQLLSTQWGHSCSLNWIPLWCKDLMEYSFYKAGPLGCYEPWGRLPLRMKVWLVEVTRIVLISFSEKKKYNRARWVWLAIYSFKRYIAHHARKEMFHEGLPFRPVRPNRLLSHLGENFEYILTYCLLVTCQQILTFSQTENYRIER